MSIDKPKVVFRRIKGRIVPIRVDRAREGRKRKLEGAGLIAGGIATVAVTDITAGFLVGKLAKRAEGKFKAAAQFSRVAQLESLLGINKGKSSRRAMKSAASFAKSFGKVTTFGKLLSAAGLFAGAEFVSLGVEKIIVDKDEQSSQAKKTLSDIAGLAVSFVGSRALLKGIKRGLKGSKFKIRDKQLEFDF